MVQEYDTYEKCIEKKYFFFEKKMFFTCFKMMVFHKKYFENDQI